MTKTMQNYLIRINRDEQGLDDYTAVIADATSEYDALAMMINEMVASGQYDLLTNWNDLDDDISDYEASWMYCFNKRGEWGIELALADFQVI